MVVNIILKSVRNRQNMSIRKLAKLSGISRTEIGRIESGEVIPRIDTLCQLAITLGVKPEELYEIGGNKEILQAIMSCWELGFKILADNKKIMRTNRIIIIDLFDGTGGVPPCQGIIELVVRDIWQMSI